MSKRIEGQNNTRNNIVFATKLILMVYTMLIAVPLLQNWLYFGKKLTCAWSLVLSVYLVYSDRKHYKTKEYLIMGLFCVAYVGTILLGNRAHFMNEILILGYTISLYFMLTYCDAGRTRTQMEKELRGLASAMVAVSFVFSAVNLGIYFAMHFGVMHRIASPYFYGLVGSQLGGIYNPNTGGTINYISLIFSVFLLKDSSKIKKSFLWVNLVVQFWCFSLVQSRGAWISFLTFIVLYFLFIWDKESLGMVKKITAKVLLVIVSVLVIIGASKGLRTATVNLTVDLVHKTSSEEQIEEIEEMEHEEGVVTTDRDMTNAGFSDFTTGRAELWRVGFEQFCKKPMMGIGYRSIDDVLEIGLSEYDYHNSGAGGLHNIYLTVFLSSGLIGGLLLVALIVLILLKVLKIYCCKSIPSHVKYMITMVPVWLVGDLVESRIAMSFNQLSVLFWIMVGYILYFAKECDKVDQCDRSGL